MLNQHPSTLDESEASEVNPFDLKDGPIYDPPRLTCTAEQPWKVEPGCYPMDRVDHPDALPSQESQDGGLVSGASQLYHCPHCKLTFRRRITRGLSP